MNKFLKTAAVAAVLSIGAMSPAFAGKCGGWAQPKCTADSNVAESLEKLIAQGNRVVGMPSIVNFFEKQMVRTLYEKRDDPTYRTYSYIVNMNGDFIFLCDSIGYGINASIQYSNPEKIIHNSGANGRSAATMPQAEPNALFMPEGLAATYVMCLNPNTAASDNPQIELLYIEPDVIVSPWPLGGNK